MMLQYVQREHGLPYLTPKCRFITAESIEDAVSEIGDMTEVSRNLGIVGLRQRRARC